MLIEVRVQLNGTLKDDLDRVADAIRVAKSGLRFSAQHIAVFGPVWERNDMGNVCGVRYRVSDTHPAGQFGIWSKPARVLEFSDDAHGSAVAA